MQVEMFPLNLLLLSHDCIFPVHLARDDRPIRAKQSLLLAHIGNTPPPSPGEVRWSLVTLPTFWSLVTLPTSLGRVASDPFVFFLWLCSLQNTSHRILFWVVACDPTYLFGRGASDHFLALAIPKHLPWPDLHSDRI